MVRVKYDGVIEAVRYAPDGKIAMVRAYERRGAVFSDHILIDRAALVELLKKGKKFITGQRKLLLASTFEMTKTVHLNGDFILTGSNTSRDLLEEVPIF